MNMAKIIAPEKVPFLLSSSDIHEVRLRQKRPSFYKFVFVHTCLLLLYTGISLVAIRTFTKGNSMMFSPIPQGSIEYHPHLFMNLNHNPFAGPPGGIYDIDESWRDLLRNVNMRVTKDELQPTNQTSVELPENGGYLAWFSVYHDLHCLKTLRQWNYRDHYFPNLTRSERSILEMHVDHCIEYIRQGAMCHADTSLTAFRWANGKDKPVLRTKRSLHMCQDWNTVESFAEQRSVSAAEMSRLVKPLEYSK